MKKLILVVLAIFLVAFTPQTTTVTAAWTTICEATTEGYPAFSIKVKNTGSNPLTACQIEVFVGPTVNDWHVIAWADCASLTAGSTARWASDVGYAEVKTRVRAQSTAGTTTHCRMDGNK
jgi:hypothetical protein